MPVLSGGPWKCKTPVALKDSPFQLLREDRFTCDDGETPITCPYHYDPISNTIIRDNSKKQDYVLDVTANFDGETLKVDWDKDTLLLADDKIKKIQVLLYYDGHYLATTFPVAKDQYSLTVKDVLSSDVTRFNVCVEVISISNEIITFNCVYFTAKESGSGTASKTKIMIAIIVPLILIAIVVVAVVAYITRCRKPVTGQCGEGIPNVMYDRYNDNEFYSEAANTPQISISGLSGENHFQEASA